MDHLTALADSTDRPAWLAARRPVITATQITSIVGSNPYSGIIDVWNEKHDPDWQEPNRSPQLDMRAAYGHEREPAIIAWASAELGIDLTPNTILYAAGLDACTPDAWAYSKGPRSDALVLVDAKTTETDWRTKGIPQHITDQMLWEWHVTGCAEIYLAVERVKWVKGVASIVDQYTYEIVLDPVRRDFLIAQAAAFRQMVADGIAPESDIDMRQIEFDTDPDDVTLWSATEDALDEIAAIEDRITDDQKRLAVLKAQVKDAATQYAGRRVHLIGTHRIAKLVRYWRAVPDYSQIPPQQIAAVTQYVLADRLVIERNPEDA